jgi:hypothetical protein
MQLPPGSTKELRECSYFLFRVIRKEQSTDRFTLSKVTRVQRINEWISTSKVYICPTELTDDGRSGYATKMDRWLPLDFLVGKHAGAFWLLSYCSKPYITFAPSPNLLWKKLTLDEWGFHKYSKLFSLFLSYVCHHDACMFIHKFQQCNRCPSYPNDRVAWVCGGVANTQCRSRIVLGNSYLGGETSGGQHGCPACGLNFDVTYICSNILLHLC